jgi:NitT/TauT family transport system substrate-binding protein
MNYMASNEELLSMKGLTHFRILISLAILSLLTGCNIDQPVKEIENPIRIYFSSWPGDYPLLLADALGMYAQYQVNVELLYLDSYSDGIVGFINKEVDTMSVVLTDALLMAQDENVQVVWLQDNSLSTIVSTQAVENPDALSGKRIGVDLRTGLGELAVESILRSYNISNEDVTFVDLDPDQIPEALGKQIDAGYTESSHINEAIRLGNKILIQVPGISPNVMIFHNDTVQNRTKDIQAIIYAWGEAVLFWESNPTDSLNLLAPYYEVDPEDLLLIVEEGIDTYSQQQNMEAFSPGWSGSLYDSASFNLNYLINSGGIRRLPNLEQFLNWQFVGRFFQDTD